MKFYGLYYLNELFGLFEFYVLILDFVLNLKKIIKKDDIIERLLFCGL